MFYYILYLFLCSFWMIARRKKNSTFVWNQIRRLCMRGQFVVQLIFCICWTNKLTLEENYTQFVVCLSFTVSYYYVYTLCFHLWSLSPEYTACSGSPFTTSVSHALFISPIVTGSIQDVAKKSHQPLRHYTNVLFPALIELKIRLSHWWMEEQIPYISLLKRTNLSQNRQPNI